MRFRLNILVLSSLGLVVLRGHDQCGDLARSFLFGASGVLERDFIGAVFASSGDGSTETVGASNRSAGHAGCCLAGAD